MKNLFLIFTSRKYFAVAQLFLCLSFSFGTWVIYIPTIKDILNLSEGDLGLVLLFGAIGAVASLPFGKRMVAKLGEGKLALMGVLLQTLAITGNFFAGSFYMLCTTLFFQGFFGGFFQIGINSLVTSLEKDDDISIMSSCHGFFSLGGIFATGVGTMLLILIGNPGAHMLIMTSVIVLLQLIFAPSYIRINKEMNPFYKPGGMNNSTFKKPIMWGLAIVVSCVMVSEGAIADWSGLFLRDVVKSGANLVGLGYAGFSVTMTLGRFLGDYLSRRFGAWQIIVSGLLFSIVGFAMVLVATPIVSICGFLFIGFGFSTIVPEVNRLSANVEGVEPSSGIAFMAGAGFVGFLAGPVALGAIAQQSGLRISFVFLTGLILLCTTTAIIVKRSVKKGQINEEGAKKGNDHSIIPFEL